MKFARKRWFPLGVASCTVAALMLSASHAHVDREVLESQVEVSHSVREQGGKAPGPSCSAPGVTSVSLPKDPSSVLISPLPGDSYPLSEFDAALWSSPPKETAQNLLWFYSHRWMQPIAEAAGTQGRSDVLELLINALQDFYEVNPDQGKSEKGWDEGTSLRRLQTLNCVYAASGDARIIPLMEREVAVQQGPRYYGPPWKPVHNHGAMANNAILQAGRLTGRADWVSLAAGRLIDEGSKAFTRQGLSHEQSAGYHLVNVGIWRSSLRLLKEALPEDPRVLELQEHLERADDVSAWLTEPDGNLVQLGDTEMRAGVDRPAKNPALFYRDDEGGLLLGRTAWGDPRSSFFSLRYGPKTWAHGHHDKGALTWSPGGERLLVDGGFSYAQGKDRAPWKEALSHNLALPEGCVDDSVTSTLQRAVEGPLVPQGAVSGFYARLGDAPCGVKHTREVEFGKGLNNLRVTDVFAEGKAPVQHWLLGPQWELKDLGDSTATLRSSFSGMEVLMSTNGGIEPAQDTTHARVWQNTKAPQKTLQLQVRGERGKRLSTSFSSSNPNPLLGLIDGE